LLLLSAESGAVVGFGLEPAGGQAEQAFDLGDCECDQAGIVGRLLVGLSGAGAERLVFRSNPNNRSPQLLKRWKSSLSKR
jgi:hypothetical protein